MVKITTLIISILVSVIITVFGTLFAVSKLPPKNQTINQTQTTTVNNKNVNIQESAQAQVTTTIVTPQTNVNMTVNYRGATNFSHSFTTETNRQSKTNRRDDKKLFNFIPIP